MADVHQKLARVIKTLETYCGIDINTGVGSPTGSPPMTAITGTNTTAVALDGDLVTA